MTTPVYKLEEGGLQWRFQNSRAKIQIFGGGFGNGKTTSACIKALQIARDYPGSNGLLARSTYPKLNDTLRKEFLKWCPVSWIESKNLSTDNVVKLKNGSVINFRYIAQQGKSAESSTSNLLSATYDYIVVDQMEDPEISHKDFLDLLGRLRGNARYTGTDPTMPLTGPRFFIICINPTRNWVYRELVKPLHDYQRGVRNEKLLVDEQGKPIIELFEGSTYSNKDNLPEDFIATMEAAYTGQMKERFLEGKWGAFEGLVYPQYDPLVHMVEHTVMLDYLRKISYDGFVPQFLESYDHGIATQACYLQAFTDYNNNVFVLQGFYEKEKTVHELAKLIKAKRQQLEMWSVYSPEFPEVLADPAVFRRTGTANARVQAKTVASLFKEEGIDFRPANNDILTGIAQVQSYLAIDKGRINPFNGTRGGPRIFFSNTLGFIDNEIVDYYWKRDTSGNYEDKPMDRNDHSMDSLKYLLSKRPRVAGMIKPKNILPPGIMTFGEVETKNRQDNRGHRYG